MWRPLENKKKMFFMENVKAYERNLLKSVKFMRTLKCNYVYIK
jgi:hypothetical protein